jgi:hypothetical protein
MGRHHALSVVIQQIAPGQQFLGVAPIALMNVGCNLQVEIATASAFVNNVSNPTPRRTLTVMSHLDTGASRTTISPVIAQHLGLVQTGVAPAQTANGPTLNPTYAIDLLFGASTLSAKADLSVGSCTLLGIGACIPREADADPADAFTNVAAWVPASPDTPARIPAIRARARGMRGSIRWCSHGHP